MASGLKADDEARSISGSGLGVLELSIKLSSLAERLLRPGGPDVMRFLDAGLSPGGTRHAFVTLAFSTMNVNVVGQPAKPDTTTTQESFKNMPGKATNPERSDSYTHCVMESRN